MKNKLLKILIGFTCLSITSSIVPIASTSCGQTKQNDSILPETVYSFSKKEDGTKVLNGFTEDFITNKDKYSYCDTLEIPNDIDEIAVKAFYNDSEGVKMGTIPSYIKNVVCQGKLKKIGEGAFYKNEQIRKVELSNDITEIENGTFSCCFSLTEINLPSKLTSIGTNAFYETRLWNVVFPNGLVSIGAGAFTNCLLKSISLPNSLKSIGNSAFYKNEFTSAIIPDSVTSIGTNAFAECYLLKNVTLSNGMTSISDGTFCNCNVLSSISLPNNLKTIGAQAFFQCERLNNLSLPSTLEKIGEMAFLKCSSLSSLNFSDSLKTIDKNCFSYCTNLESISFPSKMETIGDSAFLSCTNLKKIECRNITEQLKITVNTNAFNKICATGNVSATPANLSEYFLKWLQGRDGTSVKGNFPTTGWEIQIN